LRDDELKVQHEGSITTISFYDQDQASTTLIRESVASSSATPTLCGRGGGAEASAAPIGDGV
jgi:hypothetical protein